MKFKKTAIDLTDLAFGILILGLCVSIGTIILINIRNARLTSLDQITTTNESVARAANTPLANVWGIGVTSVCNSSGTVLTAANYTTTLDSADGRLRISNTSADDGVGNWKVTYNWYNTSRSDWSLPNKAGIGIGEYGSWFKIIVIVGVAAVVIGLILSALGRSSQGSEVGGSY